MDRDHVMKRADGSTLVFKTWPEHDQIDVYGTCPHDEEEKRFYVCEVIELKSGNPLLYTPRRLGARAIRDIIVWLTEHGYVK